MYNVHNFTGKFWFVIFVIISRYLIKEVLGSLSAVILVLLLIFLSNQLVRYLNYVTTGKIAVNIVLQLMGFEIPYLLALLLPLGLYLGIILAYGRLYADNELPVINACGLGPLTLLKITLWLTFAVMVVVTILMLWVNPVIATKKGELIAKGLGEDNILDTLQPGRFHVSNNGRRVVYVERISRDRLRANNIFIAEQKGALVNSDDEPINNTWTVVSAAEGYQMKDPLTLQNFIISSDGYRYDGTPGQSDYKIIQFKKYALRLPTPANTSKRLEQEAIPTTTLWKDKQNHSEQAELQWRFSLPISVLVLTFLALPLSRVQPRQGRYAHVFVAILIYIIYVNLLFVARNWVEQASVPFFLGMWWVHGVLFGLAILLYLLQTMRWTKLTASIQ